VQEPEEDVEVPVQRRRRRRRRSVLILRSWLRTQAPLLSSSWPTVPKNYVPLWLVLPTAYQAAPLGPTLSLPPFTCDFGASTPSSASSLHGRLLRVSLRLRSLHGPGRRPRVRVLLRTSLRTALP